MSYDYRADPILGGALAYWAGKRAGRPMPSRRDIDPTEMPSLLSHLQLIEPVCERFRYRLVGTALVEAFGRDYSGRFVDQLFDGERATFITGVYRSVLGQRRPIFLRNRYFTTKAVDLIANRLYLPLSEDGSSVNMILGALTFYFGTAPVAGVWGSALLSAENREIEPVVLD